jgi:hypothetical protein
MTDRFDLTWDLSRAGHTLTFHWTERSEKPSVPSYRNARFERDDKPWEPWQIQGMVRSMRAGTPVDEVCAGDRPRLSAMSRFLGAAGDSFFGALDRITARVKVLT